MNDLCKKEDVRLLVHEFYAAVRKDSILGPIFNDVAQVDWDAHLPIMVTFWESLLLKTDRYRRNALEPHLKLFKEIAFRQEMMDRWLMNFDATMDSHFQGETAEKAKDWARGIAHNLQRQIRKQGGLQIKEPGG
ncbi:group III truncated hemoglobin [Endozoicomonas lisbonensis]